MEEPSPDPRPDLDQLKAELSQLKQDLRSLCDSARDLGKAGAEAAGQKLDVQLQELRQLADKVRQQGAEQFQTVTEKVRERPVASVLLAFGAGLLLARLMDRS